MTQVNQRIRQYFDDRAINYEAEINQHITERRAAFIRRFTKGRVLDVGIGPGQLAALYGAAPLVGTDAALNMLRLAQSRLPESILVVADAEALPFRSGAFDTVVSSELIYYLNSPPNFLREAARVLASDGRLILLWGNSKLNPCYKLATALRLRPVDPYGLHTPSKVELSRWLDEAFPNASRQSHGLGWPDGVGRLLRTARLGLQPVNVLVLDKG